MLCAGAIHSPAMLLRAGIGAAADLRALGIDVVADLPGVAAICRTTAAVYRRASAPRRAPAGSAAAASDDLPALLLRLPDARPNDMYIAAHSKSSWSALGRQIANFNATIFKPVSRGRVSA